jgi:glycerol-3-phosphate dehydrogenase
LNIACEPEPRGIEPGTSPVSGPIADVPVAPESDIAWILEHLSTALQRPLTADDVIGTYAGLRPLVGGQDGRVLRSTNGGQTWFTPWC